MARRLQVRVSTDKEQVDTRTTKTNYTWSVWDLDSDRKLIEGSATPYPTHIAAFRAGMAEMLKVT